MSSEQVEQPPVFAFEVSCLIRAGSEDDAMKKVHAMMAFADQYEIDEGAPASSEELASMPGPVPGFVLTLDGEEIYRSSRSAGDTGNQGTRKAASST